VAPKAADGIAVILHDEVGDGARLVGEVAFGAAGAHNLRRWHAAKGPVTPHVLLPVDVEGDGSVELIAFGDGVLGLIPSGEGAATWQTFETSCGDGPTLRRVPPAMNGGYAMLVSTHLGCAEIHQQVFEVRDGRLVAREYGTLNGHVYPAGICVIPSKTGPARMAMQYRSEALGPWDRDLKTATPR
jgi:hypothetical protein